MRAKFILQDSVNTAKGNLGMMQVEREREKMSAPKQLIDRRMNGMMRDFIRVWRQGVGRRIGSTMLVWLLIAGAVAGQTGPTAEITQPTDSVLATSRIDGIDLRDDRLLWGTSEGLCLETLSGGGATQWWTPKNSPLKPIKEFPVVGFYGNELWAVNRDQFTGLGAFHFDGTTWQKYDPRRDEMLSFLVTCLLEDGKKRFWLGYEQRGIDRFQGRDMGKSTLRRFKAVKSKSVGDKKGLGSAPVWSMAESGGMIWIGTGQGLYRMDPDAPKETAFERWLYPKDFPAPSVLKMVAEESGKIVAATDFGLVFPDGNGWKLIDRKQGMAQGEIRGMAKERDRIWIGTSRGLQFFQNGKFSPVINQLTGLPADGVRCLAARTLPDGTSQVFVGTERGARIVKVKRN
jgi:hypothetical protein